MSRVPGGERKVTPSILTMNSSVVGTKRRSPPIQNHSPARREPAPLDLNSAFLPGKEPNLTPPRTGWLALQVESCSPRAPTSRAPQRVGRLRALSRGSGRRASRTTLAYFGRGRCYDFFPRLNNTRPQAARGAGTAALSDATPQVPAIRGVHPLGGSSAD